MKTRAGWHENHDDTLVTVSHDETLLVVMLGHVCLHAKACKILLPLLLICCDPHHWLVCPSARSSGKESCANSWYGWDAQGNPLWKDKCLIAHGYPTMCCKAFATTMVA